MLRPSASHWVILAGCLVSIGAMGSAFHDWREVTSPAFVFGVIGVVGSNIAAVLTRPPERP